MIASEPTYAATDAAIRDESAATIAACNSVTVRTRIRMKMGMPVKLQLPSV